MLDLASVAADYRRFLRRFGTVIDRFEEWFTTSLILDGDGAYTQVDGEKTLMKYGDFVLTPETNGSLRSSR